MSHNGGAIIKISDGDNFFEAGGLEDLDALSDWISKFDNPDWWAECDFECLLPRDGRVIGFMIDSAPSPEQICMLAAAIRDADYDPQKLLTWLQANNSWSLSCWDPDACVIMSADAVISGICGRRGIIAPVTDQDRRFALSWLLRTENLRGWTFDGAPILQEQDGEFRFSTSLSLSQPLVFAGPEAAGLEGGHE